MQGDGKMNLIVAMIWSFIGILSVIECAMGATPTWFQYFCSLICLIVLCWWRYFTDKD